MVSFQGFIRLFIPMRGCESIETAIDAKTAFVIYPHEGL